MLIGSVELLNPVILILDTPENRELLRNLVKNSWNYLGQDIYLNNWY
ncbi:hypothetical protein HYV11_02010 [Candidatus Dependentiae bacterium]|nr:hypothetical protein [Candidatus Dependentiae bacterium]